MCVYVYLCLYLHVCVYVLHICILIDSYTVSNLFPKVILLHLMIFWKSTLLAIKPPIVFNILHYWFCVQQGILSLSSTFIYLDYVGVRNHGPNGIGGNKSAYSSLRQCHRPPLVIEISIVFRNSTTSQAEKYYYYTAEIGIGGTYTCELTIRPSSR